MNSGNFMPMLQTLNDRNSINLPASGDQPVSDPLALFDVAETIQRLCNEGMLDHGMPCAKNPLLIENEPTHEALEAEVHARSLPAFDLLSKTFLQSIANQLSAVAGISIGLMVVSKTGRIVQIVDCGWKDGIARSQKAVLAKIARESVWQPFPRFSINTISCPISNDQPAVQETKPLPLTDPIRGSVFLNELSHVAGSPLLLLPIRLVESSGYVLFFCDASEYKVSGPTAFVAKASQLWLEKSAFECLVHQLDAWLIVQRCNGFMRTIGCVDWILSLRRWWLFPLAAVCLSMAAPIPYYPSRDCVFEPETKQFLCSPVQGRISSCEVRPGDQVKRGDVLGRLDDDQLRRDLATARAEFESAQKKRDSALYSRAASNAGLADIEMEQASRRVESIEDQLQRLEIRATAAGIVVQGDWHRSVGMPVTLGQNLFEVAELESMTAEVRLNTSDLGQIKVGDEVRIRSDASGGATFTGKISRIEPRATIIDDSAVFVADVIIRDPELALRPGMKASAQIKAGWKSLGWLLFNRPYRWIANQWIW